MHLGTRRSYTTVLSTWLIDRRARAQRHRHHGLGLTAYWQACVCAQRRAGDKTGDKISDKTRDKISDKMGDKINDKMGDKLSGKIGDMTVLYDAAKKEVVGRAQ